MLADVGVDPNADLQPARLQALDEALGVREHALVKGEVAPAELLHPEAVEVEDLQGDAALGHAVHEGGDGLLIVVRGEGGGQPQAEGVGRGQGGLSGQGGVVRDDARDVLAADDEILHPLARNDEGDLGDRLGRDLKIHLFGVVDEHAVPAVGDVEGDGLVRVFGAGAAVAVPHLDALAVLDKGGELLAEAVDVLAHGEVEHLADIGRALVLVVGEEAVEVALRLHARAGEVGRLRDVGGRAPALLGQQLFAVVVFHAPGLALVDAHPRLAGDELGVFVGLHRDRAKAVLGAELVFRGALALALKVLDGHLDRVFADGGKGDVQHRPLQGLATVFDHRLGRNDRDLSILHVQLIGLHGVVDVVSRLVQPKSVGKFQVDSLLARCGGAPPFPLIVRDMEGNVNAEKP